MVHLDAHPDGTILPVRAHPGARRNEIRGVQDGMLKVSVTQVPEKGKANKAVIDLLAKKLGLKKSQIELIAGETSHQKRFLLRDVKPDELAERIRRVVAVDVRGA
jgi:uncharacterized protein (TIGR00251 family)